MAYIKYFNKEKPPNLLKIVQLYNIYYNCLYNTIFYKLLYICNILYIALIPFTFFLNDGIIYTVKKGYKKAIYKKKIKSNRINARTVETAESLKGCAVGGGIASPP